MTLSFIIPVYNTESYLNKCIKSVLNQMNSSCEIIIINDGSTDESLNEIKRIAQDSGCITIIDQLNRGLGAARNAGLRMAKGHYIFFLDSDDFIFPESLSKLLPVLENCDYDIVGVDGEMLHTEGKSKPIKKDAALYNKPMPGAEYMFSHNLNAGSWYIYSRKFLLKHDLWMPEGIVHEDEMFDSIGFTHAQRVLFLPLCVYGYFRRDSSISLQHNKTFVQKKARDRVAITRELLLLQQSPNLSEIQKKGLRRKIDFLTVDQIINLIRFKADENTIYPAMKEYRKMNLFPLNKMNYSFKYKLFRWIFKNERRIIFFAKMR